MRFTKIKLQGPDAPVFDFMGWRHPATILSLLLILGSFASLAVRGLNLGLDFTGGTLIEVGYSEAIPLSDVRATLAGGGLADVVVQHFGAAGDVLIRIAPAEGRGQAQLGDEVLSLLRSGGKDVELRRVEFVGPQVGEELTVNGGLALFFALLGIFFYVLLRFHWKFSVGAVAALAHDVVIVLGMFAALQIDFDLAVLAALLAVIGYSLNDTIVVFDRCRENFRRKSAGGEVAIVNASINQMLSRTVMTSVTTLIVLLALFFVGGEALAGFSLALIAGVVVGTYSSIYVAGNVSLGIGLRRDDLIPPQVEALDPSGAQV